MIQELFKKNAFATTTSKNGTYEAVVGKPKNNVVNLHFNFNIMAYKLFIAAIDNSQLMRVNRASDYDDNTSGMSIELLGEGSLNQLITDLPEMIYQYVENALPTNIIHQGTKA